MSHHLHRQRAAEIEREYLNACRNEFRLTVWHYVGWAVVLVAFVGLGVLS